MPSLASPSRKFSKKERSLTSRLARSLARPAAHSTFAVEGFVAAPAFGGAKAGFVFRSGPNGLGYYPDRRA